jgi:hypothetical protein
MMKAAIHVGASKEAIKEAQRAILAILTAKTDYPAAISEALITLRTLCAVNGTVISNNNFKVVK